MCTYCSWTRYVQYGYRIYRYEQQMIGGTVRLVVQAICSTRTVPVRYVQLTV
jgi:hypothetical protein